MQASPSRSIGPAVAEELTAAVTKAPQWAEVGLTRKARSRGHGNDGTAELVHDASHILGSLRRYSQLIATPGVLSEEHGHLAHELQVLSDRSAAMLGRLVVLGAPEVQLAAAAAGVEATVLPEAVLELLGLLSRMAGRAVSFFCSPSAYFPVAISRSGFERLLVNLVKNAADADEANGTVAVTLLGMRDPLRDGVQLVLTVGSRSRGGMAGRLRSGETRPVQADEDVSRGVGFQVVRRLAESTGAKVEVEHERGVCMSVSVSWPAIDPRRDRRVGVVDGGLAESFGTSGMETPAQPRAMAPEEGRAC